MDIKIITPKTEKDIADGLQLGYEYAEIICKDPFLEQYFKSQNFLAEIDKMPKGYEPPDGAYLIAYANDEAVGTVALKRLDDDVCEMKRLFVIEKYQGNGIGRLLAEHIINEGKKLGYKRMRLDSSRSVMSKAVFMYKALGFYEIEPYNQNCVPDALFMEKIL